MEINISDENEYAMYLNGSEVHATFLGFKYAEEGSQKLALEYFQIAADLCDPIALGILRHIYAGEQREGIKEEKNPILMEKYLKRLAFIDEIVDLNTNLRCKDPKQKEFIEEDQLRAYAQLGLLYIEDDSFNKNWLGYLISLDGAENKQLAQSMYAMGMWFLLHEECTEDNMMSAAGWFDHCIQRSKETNDSQSEKAGVWGYNKAVEIINQNWRN